MIGMLTGDAYSPSPALTATGPIAVVAPSISSVLIDKNSGAETPSVKSVSARMMTLCVASGP